MNDTQVVAIGQAVGQAEAVLSRLLAGVLARTGTSRQDYIAMQRLTALGGEASRYEYVNDLSSWLHVDLWGAGELAGSLAQAGLLDDGDGMVRFAPPGAALRDQITGAASAVTRALLAPVDPADLATTIRTLEQVTARARTVLEGSREGSPDELSGAGGAR